MVEGAGAGAYIVGLRHGKRCPGAGDDRGVGLVPSDSRHRNVRGAGRDCMGSGNGGIFDGNGIFAAAGGCTGIFAMAERESATGGLWAFDFLFMAAWGRGRAGTFGRHPRAAAFAVFFPGGHAVFLPPGI